MITNNYIAHITRNSKNYSGILAMGVVNLKIKYNYFEDMNRPILIAVTKNTGAGSMYSATYNVLNGENIADLSYNHCTNVLENFIRYNNQYNYYNNEQIIYLCA